MNACLARTCRTQARFLQANGRRLFALDIEPIGACTGAVLYLPPFAEEMNRLRSHVVAQARALAGRGLRCVLLDLHGTGESEGHIVDADWEHWLADGRVVARWLAEQAGHLPTLWGVRTGALLAAELAITPERALASRLLFWQPVLDGKLFMTQYLRLRIASQVVKESERETTEQIRTRLSAGEIVEVAGYPLTGRIAEQIAARCMADFAPGKGLNVAWVEVAARPEQPLAPASQKMVDTWRSAGTLVRAATVASPMVWQAHRREDAPELLDATLKLMERVA